MYAIALNEEKFAARFADSCRDADLIVVGDTGSTDNTVDILKNKSVIVHNIHISPWRFDNARNAVLSLVPKDIDICISIDIDECLVEGWRSKIDKAWQESPNLNRIRYKYIWSWNENNTPKVEFINEKIHSRNGYTWLMPCHEYLKAHHNEEKVILLSDLVVEHHPDNDKSRSQYLSLLELGVKEKPYCDRSAYYYARELFFYKKYKEAVEEFKRYLNLNTATWKEERASSYRFLSDCYLELNNYDEAKNTALRSVLEYSETRDSWIQVAKVGYFTKDWHTCLWALNKAFQIDYDLEKQSGHTETDLCYGWYPYDLAAIAYYNLNQYDKAHLYGKLALNMSAQDTRLQSNLEFYIQKLKHENNSNNN